jgi:integrase
MKQEKRRLTDKLVEDAPVGAIQWDSEVRGFGVRVHPTGRRVYLLRLPGGRQGRSRWLTIGDHGTMPARPGRDPQSESARDEARRMWGLTAQGVDVAARRDRGKETPDLEAFSKSYLRDYATPHKRPATVAADKSLLKVILPVMGRIRVDRIDREDVARLHAALRTTPTRANRVRALLSHMMATAELWGERPLGTNPCGAVKPYRETKRERFLSVQELRRLGAVLSRFEKASKVEARTATPKLTPFGLAAIRLLIFLGARLSEVLKLRWAEIDTKTKTARIPASKTGAKTLFLNPPALAVLKEIPRVSGCPYVIAGRKPGEALTVFGLEQVWQGVRAEAGLEDVRLHDLRHSFASVAVAGGATLPVIGALLGHSQPSVTARYAHLAASPLVAASSSVAGRIAAAMRPKRSKGNVVAIGKGR